MAVFIFFLYVIYYFVLDTFISKNIVEAMERRQSVLFDSDCFILAIYLDIRVNVLLDEHLRNKAKQFLILLSSIINEKSNSSPEEQRIDPGLDENDEEIDDLELELRTAALDRASNLAENEITKISIDIELENYLKLPREDKNKNIMEIWSNLRKKFPLLYECAEVALALPTTQVIIQ